MKQEIRRSGEILLGKYSPGFANYPDLLLYFFGLCFQLLAGSILNEISPSSDLGEVFHGPDQRREVEGGVERPAEPALAPNGLAEREERDGRTQPRNSAREFACRPALGELTEFLALVHAPELSKTRSRLRQGRPHGYGGQALSPARGARGNTSLPYNAWERKLLLERASAHRSCATGRDTSRRFP